ncbi:MAG: hypothetical protein H7222_13380 [Methylotenera sp.]|nr:hypothetical protein [Oligoflexia bacterium]
MSNAVLALEPWNVTPSADRKLAAISNEFRHLKVDLAELHPAEDQQYLMSRSDRESWQEWTVELLKETQGALDALATEPRLAPARQEMQEIANLVVRLNGISQRGDAQRMISVLGQLKAKVQTVVALGCTSK